MYIYCTPASSASARQPNLTRTHIQAYMHAHIQACTHTSIHAYTHTYIQEYIHTYIHIYRNAYIHTNIHAGHTRIHTYTHSRLTYYIYACIHYAHTLHEVQQLSPASNTTPHLTRSTTRSPSLMAMRNRPLASTSPLRRPSHTISMPYLDHCNCIWLLFLANSPIPISPSQSG